MADLAWSGVYGYRTRVGVGSKAILPRVQELHDAACDALVGRAFEPDVCVRQARQLGRTGFPAGQHAHQARQPGKADPHFREGTIMEWEGGRESENVEDRRSFGGTAVAL